MKTLKGNHNLAWIILFVRNSGERIRAIRLAADALDIGLVEARDWVDQLRFDYIKVDRSKARKFHAENPCNISEEQLRDYVIPTVNYWPSSASSENK